MAIQKSLNHGLTPFYAVLSFKLLALSVADLILCLMLLIHLISHLLVIS
jgi:hypothetical protein